MDMSLLLDPSSGHAWDPNEWAWDPETLQASHIAEWDPAAHEIHTLEAGMSELKPPAAHKPPAPQQQRPAHDKSSAGIRAHARTSKSGGGSGSGSGGWSGRRCQVEGCDADLSKLKMYNRRFSICDTHARFPMLVVGGRQQRFCQMCGQFHDTERFDGTNRNCRERLSAHASRRRALRAAKSGERGAASEAGSAGTSAGTSAGKPVSSQSKGAPSQSLTAEASASVTVVRDMPSAIKPPPGPQQGCGCGCVSSGQFDPAPGTPGTMPQRNWDLLGLWGAGPDPAMCGMAASGAGGGLSKAGSGCLDEDGLLTDMLGPGSKDAAQGGACGGEGLGVAAARQAGACCRGGGGVVVGAGVQALHPRQPFQGQLLSSSSQVTSHLAPVGKAPAGCCRGGSGTARGSDSGGGGEGLAHGGTGGVPSFPRSESGSGLSMAAKEPMAALQGDPTQYAPEFWTERLIVKMLGSTPDHIPQYLYERCNQWLMSAPLSLLGYIRPGCVVLAVDAVVPAGGGYNRAGRGAAVAAAALFGPAAGAEAAGAPSDSIVQCGGEVVLVAAGAATAVRAEEGGGQLPPAPPVLEAVYPPAVSGRAECALQLTGEGMLRAEVVVRYMGRTLPVAVISTTATSAEVLVPALVMPGAGGVRGAQRGDPHGGVAWVELSHPGGRAHSRAVPVLVSGCEGVAREVSALPRGTVEERGACEAIAHDLGVAIALQARGQGGRPDAREVAAVAAGRMAAAAAAAGMPAAAHLAAALAGLATPPRPANPPGHGEGAESRLQEEVGAGGGGTAPLESGPPVGAAAGGCRCGRGCMCAAAGRVCMCGAA